MSEVTLKPCPWCGKAGEVRDYGRAPADHAFYARCSNRECEVRPETMENYTEWGAAAEAWNTRYQPEPDHGDD